MCCCRRRRRCWCHYVNCAFLSELSLPRLFFWVTSTAAMIVSVCVRLNRLLLRVKRVVFKQVPVVPLFIYLQQRDDNRFSSLSFFYYFAKNKTISVHSIFYNLFFSGEWNKIKKHQHTRTNRQRSALVGSLREIYAGMMMRGEQRVEGLHQVPPLPGGRHSRSRASLFLSLSHSTHTRYTLPGRRQRGCLAPM